MAGFSLTDASNQQQGDQRAGIPAQAESLFLYGGSSNGTGADEIATYTAARGFELWQPQHLQIQRQDLQLYEYSSSTGLTLPPHELGTSMRRGFGGGTGGGVSCQDCGNQAKKDCSHLRCRTCCKSRGFHCSTHVKSTWVPVAKRRERQQQRAAAASMSTHRETEPGADRGSNRGGGSSAGRRGEPSRRSARDITAYTRLPMATTTTSGSSGGGARYPPEVSTHAAFRCVRVSTADDAEDEFAYQTAVSIGGHVFKGILYDHGPEPESRHSSAPSYQHLSESSSPPPATTNITTTAAAAAAASVGVAGGSVATAAFLDSYPTPLSAFMAGTQFFPHHPRP